MPVTSTATVETLTAEVRVLMVGSRQITLSVFRQLDWVEWAQCEPMGRVNDGDGRIVVGRHKTTGSLVRSNFDVHYGRGGPVWDYNDQREYEQLTTAIKRTTESLSRWEAEQGGLYAKRDDTTLSLNERRNAEWEIERREREAREAAQLLPRDQVRLAELISWHTSLPNQRAAYDAAVKTFTDLPLIVLAGLR